MSYTVTVTDNKLTGEDAQGIVYEQTVDNLKLAEVIKAVNKPERKKRTTTKEQE